MSQHDYDIANASGAAVRSDLNSVLGAIATWNSGASGPSTTFARQRWADTTNGVIKRRNAANSAWIAVSTDDESLVLSRSSDTILDSSDIGKTFVATAAFTQTLTAAATLGDGWFVYYRNESTGNLIIDPNSSEQIDGATTVTLYPGDGCLIVCNGSAFKTIGLRSRGIVLGTEQATTSGTSIDFTGIPAGVRRITVQLVGVSTNGTSGLILQLGDSGGVETTGYTSSSSGLSTVVTTSSSSAGFVLAGSTTAAAAWHGAATLDLEDASDNTWGAETSLGETAAPTTWHGAGSKALSAILDRVRLTTVGGTDTFDAGVANISWEF